MNASIELTPALLRLSDGTFLAIAPSDSPIRLGGWGASESEAERSFDEALERLNEALASS
jgi:hypothetical protein